MPSPFDALNRSLVAPVCSENQLKPLLVLVSVTPPSPTVVKKLPLNATRFRFGVVPLALPVQFVPSGLVAIRPFSPTATKVPLPKATPRSHWLSEAWRFQLTPLVLV